MDTPSFQALALLSQHEKVIYYAALRVADRHAENFDELVQAGRAYYLRYVDRYQDPLDTKDAIEKFNHMVGYFIYLQLTTIQKRRRRRQEQTAALTTTLGVNLAGSQEDLLSHLILQESLTTLSGALTPKQNAVLKLMLAGVSPKAIGQALGISRQAATRLRDKVRSKARAYLL